MIAIPFFLACVFIGIIIGAFCAEDDETRRVTIVISLLMLMGLGLFVLGAILTLGGIPA